MVENRWDLFASKDSPGSLWFAFQAAKCLSERRQQVRLFTDDISRLSLAVNELDPGLLLQRHGSIDILDSRLAASTMPSPKLVQFFQSTVPQAYVSRFVAQTQKADWVHIGGCGSGRNTSLPLTLLEASTSFRRFTTRLGDPPHHGGYVKQRFHSLIMRQRWSQTRVRHSLLSLLSLPLDIFDDRLVVYVGASPRCAVHSWARMLSSEQRRVTVLVESGDQCMEICKALALSPQAASGLVPIGQTNFVFLPTVQWFIADELLAIADVVLTDQLDIAIRATECGAPLLWGGAADGEDEFADWYVMSAKGSTRNVLLDAFAALRSDLHTGQAWRWFKDSIADAARHAASLSSRMQRGADMTDVLLSGIGEEFHHASPEQFSPTQPHALGSA